MILLKCERENFPSKKKKFKSVLSDIEFGE